MLSLITPTLIMELQFIVTKKCCKGVCYASCAAYLAVGIGGNIKGGGEEISCMFLKLDS